MHTGAYPSAAQNAEIAAFAASRRVPPLGAHGRSATGLMWGAAVAHTGLFPATHECGYGGCPSWCEEAKNGRVCHAVIYREVNDYASALAAGGSPAVPPAWPRPGAPAPAPAKVGGG